VSEVHAGLKRLDRSGTPTRTPLECAQLNEGMGVVKPERC
jgi:hypothetical protein